MLRFGGGVVAAALFGVSFLTGCNGGSAIPTSDGSFPLQHKIGSEGHRKNTCLKAACIYIGNEGGSVAVYELKANGNVAPVQYIAGSQTGLDDVWAVAVDSARNIYAANYQGGTYHYGSLTVYSAGSNGNTAPIATIYGSSGYAMISPSGIAVDAAGNIYASARASDSVSVYPPGSNGPSAPIQFIKGSATGLAQPTSLAVDAKGKMFVTDGPLASVTSYAAGATGNVAPVQTIAGSKTGLGLTDAVAVDRKGRIYVTSSPAGSPTGCCVDVFAKNATGNVVPLQSISGSNTQIDEPGGIAVDSNDTIYVSNSKTNSITVFAAGSNGNVAPVRVISGSKTMLSSPSDLAIH